MARDPLMADKLKANRRSNVKKRKDGRLPGGERQTSLRTILCSSTCHRRHQRLRSWTIVRKPLFERLKCSCSHVGYIRSDARQTEHGEARFTDYRGDHARPAKEQDGPERQRGSTERREGSSVR